MNNRTPSREAELVEQLRRSYVSKGYKFIAQPRGEDSPSFLANFVPDAIALSSSDKVVLEIKSSKTTNSKNALVKFLADEVPKHPGWRFELIIDNQNDGISDHSADPSLQAIGNEIVKVEDLLAATDLKLGVVAGWATLEALSRKLVFEELSPAPLRYKPRSVVEGLVSEGFIDDADGARLLEISQIRNRLVHGFTQIDVQSDDVRYLIDTLKKLKDFAIEKEK